MFSWKLTCHASELISPLLLFCILCVPFHVFPLPRLPVHTSRTWYVSSVVIASPVSRCLVVSVACNCTCFSVLCWLSCALHSCLSLIPSSVYSCLLLTHFPSSCFRVLCSSSPTPVFLSVLPVIVQALLQPSCFLPPSPTLLTLCSPAPRCLISQLRPVFSLSGVFAWTRPQNCFARIALFAVH